MNRLNEIEARANAATPGPWASVINDRRMYHVVTDNEEFCQTYGPELYDSQGFFSDDDTEFIAHARTDVPALVAALYEVLDQHQRVVLPTYLPIGRMEDVSICGVCTVEGEPADWPCPTVETIRQHIGDDL